MTRFCSEVQYRIKNYDVNVVESMWKREYIQEGKTLNFIGQSQFSKSISDRERWNVNCAETIILGSKCMVT